MKEYIKNEYVPLIIFMIITGGLLLTVGFIFGYDSGWDDCMIEYQTYPLAYKMFD